MAFLDILLFAVIALFCGYRLWLMLGTHDADKPLRKRRSAEDDVVIPGRKKQPPPEMPPSPPEEVVDPQHLADAAFLKGASTAFRKIVEAYGAGDIPCLLSLLEEPLLGTFEAAIAKRTKAHQVLEVDIGRIVTADILDRREEDGKAYVTVRFVSEQCLLTRDKKGALIEGDPDRYAEVTDIWTFSRPLKSSNPNWKLVATQVPEG